MKAETTIEFTSADVIDALREKVERQYGEFKSAPTIVVLVGGKEIGDKPIEARVRFTEASEGAAAP